MSCGAFTVSSHSGKAFPKCFRVGFDCSHFDLIQIKIIYFMGMIWFLMSIFNEN